MARIHHRTLGSLATPWVLERIQITSVLLGTVQLLKLSAEVVDLLLLSIEGFFELSAFKSQIIYLISQLFASGASAVMLYSSSPLSRGLG